MVKRLILLALLAAIPITIWAAAPADNNWANWIDTITIDSQFTTTPWELIDSIAVVKSDTCYTLYTMQGVAKLSYGDKLYLGFIDGGGPPGATSTATDTFIVEMNTNWQSEYAYVPFCVTYLDSAMSQVGINDTIYFMGAVKGSATSEKVVIENLLLKAQVLDFSAAGVHGE